MKLEWEWKLKELMNRKQWKGSGLPVVNNKMNGVYITFHFDMKYKLLEFTFKVIS